MSEAKTLPSAKGAELKGFYASGANQFHFQFGQSGCILAELPPSGRNNNHISLFLSLFYKLIHLSFQTLVFQKTMPICKSSQVTASKKTATDISADHVTEAAQVQRTREQAYFNSYDFDAIEVLPYDEEDDDTGDTSQGRSRSRSQSRSQSRSGSSSSRSSSAKSYSAAHDPNGVGKFAYLQRLGAFFARSGGNGGAGAAGEGVSSTTGGSGAAAGLKPTSSSENFLLPRAMLKYQR